MSRGGKFLFATAVLTVAACSMDQGKLEIRSTPSALNRGAQPVPQRIAEARGHLALGNVALALEAFRKASRDDPNSSDAFAGMADCYDRMGRQDLSRRYYETALALAPADSQLLGAFAASLQRQGLNAEAMKVREEIAARSLARTIAAPQAELALRVSSATPTPALASMDDIAPSTTVLPAGLLASSFAMTPIEAEEPTLAPRQFASPDVQLAEPPTPARVAVSLPDVERTAIIQKAPQGSSVSIKLPPVRQVALAAPTEPTSLKPSDRPASEPSFARSSGPRLERLSMGEIRLVTASAPVWQSATVARSQSSTTIRFIPLRQASLTTVRVRLLNAARVDRLAARTRNWLLARGWRGMTIGDAQATRRQSVVLYPADKRSVAQKLASQFGFALAQSSSGRHVTVLLGNDAARHPALRRSRA